MNITKRDFIKIGGGAALAGAAFPSFAAKSAKPSYGGRKVRIAAIGTGGMARGDLNNFLRTGLAEVVCAARLAEEGPAEGKVLQGLPQDARRVRGHV